MFYVQAPPYEPFAVCPLTRQAEGQGAVESLERAVKRLYGAKRSMTRARSMTTKRSVRPVVSWPVAAWGHTSDGHGGASTQSMTQQLPTRNF